MTADLSALDWAGNLVAQKESCLVWRMVVLMALQRVAKMDNAMAVLKVEAKVWMKVVRTEYWRVEN